MSLKYEGSQGYSRVLDNTRGVLKGTRGCSRVLDGTRGYSRVLEGARWYSRVLEGARGCSMVLEGTRGYSRGEAIYFAQLVDLVLERLEALRIGLRYSRGTHGYSQGIHGVLTGGVLGWGTRVGYCSGRETGIGGPQNRSLYGSLPFRTQCM
jgi:hypothetical protein